MARIVLNVELNNQKVPAGIKQIREQIASLGDAFGKIQNAKDVTDGIKALTDQYKALAEAASGVVKVYKKQMDEEAKLKSKYLDLEKQYADFIKTTQKAGEQNKDFADGMKGVLKSIEDAHARLRAYNKEETDVIESTEELNLMLKEAKKESASLGMEYRTLTKSLKDGAEAEKAVLEERIRQEIEAAEKIAYNRKEEQRLNEETANERKRQETEEAEAIKKTREEEERSLQEHLEAQRKLKESYEQAWASFDKVFGNAAIRLWRTWWSEVKNILGDVNDVLTKTENTVIELQRVLNDTVSDRQISNALYDLAQKYGQTFENASTIAQNFAKSGMSWNDTIKATESALLAMNVAELNASESSEGLLSIMVQFKKDASELETIVDQLNKTADKNPVTTEKLLKALQRTGSAAATSNLTLEKTIGIITTLSAATNRSGQNIGTATNALIMYTQKNLDIFAQMSEESAKVVENFKRGTADIVDIWKAAQDEINKLKNDKDKFNSMIDLFGGAEGMEELNSSLHDELEDTFEQINSVYNIANTYRKNYFIALLDNLDRLDKVQEQLQDAQGYSQEENLKYMGTLEAKTNTLHAKWEELANDEQGLLKFRKDLVDLGIKAIDLVKGMGGIVNVLKTITGLITGILVIVKASTIAKKVQEVTTTLSAMKSALQGVASAAQSTEASFGWIGVVIAGLSLLSGIIDGVYNNLKNQAQANVDAAEASRDNARELADLYSQLNDVDEKSDEYYAILEKIVPLLGDKAKALQGLKEDADAYSKALSNLSKTELEVELAKQKLARDSYTNPTWVSWDQIPSATQSAFSQLTREWAFETGHTGVAYTRNGMETVDVPVSNQSLEITLQVYDWIKEQRDKVAGELNRIWGLMAQTEDEGIYKELETQYNEYNDDFKTYENIINEFGGQLEGFRATILSIQDIQATLDSINGVTGGHSGSFILEGTSGANLGGKDLLQGATDLLPNDGTFSWSPKKGKSGTTVNKLPGGNGGTGSTVDEYLESLKDIVALRKSELTLMQHQGASLDEQVAKSKEIQDALHVQAEYLRQKGADQAEINALSSEWYSIQESIVKLVKSQYTDEINLIKSRLTLMEHQEVSADKQIEQMKKIQDQLHQEAEYLRSIKATEEEINAVSSEWWTWQEKILKLYQDTLNTAKELELEAIEKLISSIQEEIDLEKTELDIAERRLAITQAEEKLEKAIAQAKIDYVSEVLSNYISALADAQTLEEKRKAVSDAREKYATAEKKAQTDAVIKAMQAQRDLGNDTLSLEEKRLAVEEARQALIDAQNDRTTRVYDEETGQWRYEANAQNVKSAQEKLADAMKSLDDYLEGEAWDELLEKMENGSLTEGEMASILNKWASEGYGANEWTEKIREAYRTAIGTKADPDSLTGELNAVNSAVDNLNTYLKNQAIKELQQYIKDGNTSTEGMQQIMNKWLSMGEGGEIWKWSDGVISEVSSAIKSGWYDKTKVSSAIEGVESAVKSLHDYFDTQFVNEINKLLTSGTAAELYAVIEKWRATGEIDEERLNWATRGANAVEQRDDVNAKYDENAKAYNAEALADAMNTIANGGVVVATGSDSAVEKITSKLMDNIGVKFDAASAKQSMGIMVGATDRTPSATPIYNNASSISDSHNITYVNGVPITSDMAERYTISELLEVLPVLKQ